MKKGNKNYVPEVEWNKAEEQKAQKRLEVYNHGMGAIVKKQKRKEEN